MQELREIELTEEQKKENQIELILFKLDELTKDFVQEMLGAVIPNIEDKKAEFIELHNELRELEGKAPREYVKEE